MLRGMQTPLLLFILLFSYCHTVKPPGYVEQQKTDGDPNPPKYEYGYNIIGDKGGEQGKQEQRDGIYASGRYFVQNKDARQDVQYFADDWGYHPAVEYANVGPHSRASAKFALGHEAVVQLRNKENNLPQLEGLPDTGPLKKEGPSNGPIQPQNLKPLIAEPQNPQPALLVPIPSQQTIIQKPSIKEAPQPPYDPFKQQAVLVQEQPQQIIQEQPQLQQIAIEQPKVQLQQVVEDRPRLQQTVYDQPQVVYEQQVVHNEQPQLQQVVYEQQQLKQQPQLQQVVYEQQQIKQEPQQLVIQHIQQPIENVIFPQPTPTPVVYQHQEPSHQNLIVDQQQPNIILLGQQDVPTAEKLIKNEEEVNALSFQQFGLKIKERRPSKLIESTQHLISGQDVLDINGAVTNHEEIGIQSVTPYPTVTEYTPTEPSLKEQPIVVADVDNKIISSTESVLKEQEQIVSTTASTLEAVSTTYESSTPTPTIVVTPRPVSTTFLAPITAGIRLESTEHNEEKYKLSKQNVQIEVQKTIPYYLGKYEYPLTQQGYLANQTLVDQSVRDDIELGKTLLYFPGQSTPPKHLNEIDNHITLQQLPNTVVDNQFVELDQQLAQGYQHQVILQNVPTEQKEVTKIIHQPYPVKVPYEVRVPVVKQVAVPVTVEKVIEKPVHITKIVEKPVAVPQPYPVEKIVEKPVHVPVQITKYIDRPYPVEVRVPYPQPYPVEKIVQKVVKQPYPVEVRVPVPVDRIVEKKVPVPHYIEKPVPVEKIVEKPVPQYVDRPYPVHIQVPVPTPVAVPVDRIIEKKVPVPHYIEKPVTVEKIVEKPVPQYIDRPYPVEVKVPVPQPYYVKVEVPRPYQLQLPTKYIEKPYYLPVQKLNQWTYGGVALNPHIQSSIKSQQQLQTLNSHIQHSLNLQHQTINLGGVKDAQLQPAYYNIQAFQLQPAYTTQHQASYSNLKDAQLQSTYSNIKEGHLQPTYSNIKDVHLQPAYVNIKDSKLQSGFSKIKDTIQSTFSKVQDLQLQSSYSNVKVIDQSTSDGYHYPNPYAYAPQNNYYLPPKKEFVVSNEYLPPVDKNCDHHQEKGNDNYIGLLPPKIGQQLGKFLRKYRSARSNFDDKSVKMEYGFMPPLVPSLEIDEFGQPIEKGEK